MPGEVLNIHRTRKFFIPSDKTLCVAYSGSITAADPMQNGWIHFIYRRDGFSLIQLWYRDVINNCTFCGLVYLVRSRSSQSTTSYCLEQKAGHRFYTPTLVLFLISQTVRLFHPENHYSLANYNYNFIKPHGGSVGMYPIRFH